MVKIIVFISLLTAAFTICPPCATAEPSISPDLLLIENDTKISLDLKEMDIVEAIKMLASKGNLNVIVGSTVRGKVTMFLKDVNLKDAFEIILLANNLASDQRGEIVYIMPDREYEALYGERFSDRKQVKVFTLKYSKAIDVGKVLEQIKTKIGKVVIDEGSNTLVMLDMQPALLQAATLVSAIDKPTITRIFELRYANVKEIKDKVSDMLTKNIGSMRADERTNKIVVTDLEERIKEIEKVVAAFDDKLQQVFIEAKIIEITLTDKNRFGIDWSEVFKQLGKQIKISNAFKLAATGAAVPGGELMIGTLGDNGFSALVQMLKEIGDTNTLASPRIAALNNQEARILIGSSEPYATNTVTQGTSTTTTATNLTFLQIGVKLYVTPTINKDGFVTMKIKPEISSKTGDYTYGSPPTTVPIVSTTEAETSVTIRDGMTIIIAGLIKDNRTSTVDKIPLIGDIPLAGMAFKKIDKKIEKKELVIFLTPHIVSGEVDYTSQPKTEPLGKKLFTVAEQPTFEKRKPFSMNPDYLDKRLAGEDHGDQPVSDGSGLPEAYFASVKEKIMRSLMIGEEAKAYLKAGDRAVVTFSVYAGGNLLAAPVITRSTNAALDIFALEAVERAAPFKPFPPSISGYKRRLSIEIAYQPSAASVKEASHE